MKITDPLPVLRKSENLHILLWLIKDSCWMLEIRWLGTLMIVPTVSVAIWITWMTRKGRELFINMAVFFWIVANSAWMLMEFFKWEDYKLYTGIPFAFGLISVFIFYFLFFRQKRASSL